MNTLKLIGQLLSSNLVTILFLLGLTLVNIACYIKFGSSYGMAATGITLIVVSIILLIESNNAPTNK